MLVPRMLVQASLGGTPVPSISSLTTADERVGNCFQTWRVNVSWTILNPDNAAYKLKLVVGSTVLSDTLDCASATYGPYNSELIGDTTMFDNELVLTFTLQVLRRSDNAVMASADVNATKYYGDCP